MKELGPDAIARLKAAILKCIEDKVYPSAKQIKIRMEMAKAYSTSPEVQAKKIRKDHTLSGTECQARNKIFKELGIKVKRTAYNDPDNKRSDWWNI